MSNTLNMPGALTLDMVKALTKVAFPAYRGRKFRIEVKGSYHMEAYWSGGTRYDVRLVNLASGEIAAPVAAVGNPMNQVAHATITIPQGVVLLEHCYFCGKDLGIRAYIAPPAALPAAAEVLALGDGT